VKRDGLLKFLCGPARIPLRLVTRSRPRSAAARRWDPHPLEKLKNWDLVRVRREATYLWYSANTEALQELLGFLYAECCTRNKAVQPEKILCRK
jgi:hypothetical protein